MTAVRAVRHPGELRWETRLLGVVTLVLLAFGVAATYGAASLVTVQGQNVGLGFAARQLSGAVLGGILLLWRPGRTTTAGAPGRGRCCS